MIIVELLNATLATQKAVCNRILMAISFSSFNFIMFRSSEKIKYTNCNSIKNNSLASELIIRIEVFLIIIKIIKNTTLIVTM